MAEWSNEVWFVGGGGMGSPGLELPRFPSGKSGVEWSGGNKSGNTDAPRGDFGGVAVPTDPELAALIAAWPDLPPAIRAGIVAMVAATTPTTLPTAPEPYGGGR